MKNKRLLFLLIFVLIIILISIYFIIKNFKTKNSIDGDNTFSEYTPEEEISSKQMRETSVSLFFVDSDNNMKCEGKLIDSAELLQNPYKKLIELLLSGPQTNNLLNIFPENTKILDAELKNNCVVLNFSEEFLNYKDDNQKLNMINCVLNTLKQLNEVNSIKILIGGNLQNEFDEIYNLVN